MAINGFSVGRDVTLNIQTPNGPLVSQLVTNFDSRPEMPDTRIKGLDGITRHVRFFDGWNGKFEFERMDGSLDTYFATLESNYYAGQNEIACSLTETISEPDGSTSQYYYTGVLLKLDDAGSWAGDRTVKMSVSFVASRRLKIA